MKKILTAAALTVALVAGGSTTAAALHKDITLIVDGQEVPGSTFAVNVTDILNGNGITLRPGDTVSPDVTAQIADGQRVTVTYAKPMTLTINGKAEKLVSMDRTLAQILDDRAIPGLDQAWTSIGLNETLPRTGIDVFVSTPKPIKLTVAGKSTMITTNANTPAAVLAERGLSADADDVISPAPNTSLTSGAEVKLDRVVISTKKVVEAFNAPVVKKKNASLWAGESKTLVAGKAGKADRTYQITMVNGKVAKKVILQELVLIKPSAATVEVGTKTSANGVGINLARAAMWDRIARCESGGNWKINTGNGYYGGLQFNVPSWRANGGRDFAARPDQATREQQITVANRYYAKAGLSPWGCAHAA